MNDTPPDEPLELTPRTSGSVVSRSSQLVRRGLNELTTDSDRDEQAILADALGGDANAQWELACRRKKRGDSVESIKWLHFAAEQGHLNAQSTLYSCYEYGIDVAKDEIEAAKWCRKAAEQGDLHSARQLGSKYQNGLGVPRSIAEAIRWYRVAAEKGELLSAVWLGSMYNRGEGVPVDPEEASRWLRHAGHRAIEENDTNIMSSLGDAYKTGVLCDYAESMTWYHMAAERGDPMSMCELGHFYLEGRGVQKNFAKMVEWYRIAAEKGFDMGKGCLAECYALGLGVQQDYVQAYAWFKRASTLPVGDKLKSLAEKMTSDQIAEAERLGNEWNPQWDWSRRAKSD